MSKIDEIAKRYDFNWGDGGRDIGWLVNRVRQLQTALQFYENIETYKGDWDRCPIWNDFGIKAREALKES